MNNLDIQLDQLMQLTPKQLLEELTSQLNKKYTVAYADHAPMSLAEFKEWEANLKKGDNHAD